MINQILDIINWVVIGLVMCTLSLQMIYSLFIVVPNKKYPEAKKLHKYAVVIAARNEEKVIASLIRSLLNQNYPEELLDIFVVCHNCTDGTKEVAENCGGGARVKTIEVFDDNKKRKRKGYALKAGFDVILKDYPEYEGFFVFDADNVVSSDFVKEMNNAFDSGVKVCQGYRNSKNLEDNAVAGVNGLFFLRDCRFNAHARTFIHSSAMIFGTGFLFARELIEDRGWTAFNFSEDAEFTMQLVLKKQRVQYVAKAEFFDEQPTSFIESMQRQARVGRGIFKLFFQYGYKLLGRFFISFNFKYLDMFLSLLYAPVSMLCVIWFPAYYCYLPITMILQGNMTEFYDFLIFVAKTVGLAILLPITVQNLLIYLLDWKRLRLKKVRRMVTTLLFFPIFNFCYALAITIGILNFKLRWKEIRHVKTMEIKSGES